MGQTFSATIRAFEATAGASDGGVSLLLCSQLLCGGTAGVLAGCAGAVVAHELAHLAVASGLGLLPDSICTANAAYGALRWAATHAAWLPCYLTGAGHLLPGLGSAGGMPPSISLPLPPGMSPDHWRLALVRHAGWIASTALAVAACWIAAALAATAGPATSAVLYGVAGSSVSVLIGALASDLLGLQPTVPPRAATCPTSETVPASYVITGQTVRSGRAYSDMHLAGRARSCTRHSSCDGTSGRSGGGAIAVHVVSFFCGNIGLLVAAAAGSTVDMMSVLRSQIAISSQRGAQSGGLVTLVESGSGAAPAGSGKKARAVIDGVRSRCAPGKRDHLSVALHHRFGRALGRAPRLAGGHGIFVGHTRFATSSQPSEGESHPHQWSPPFMTPVWRADPSTGRLSVAEERFGVWITHNGDFDFWRLMGQDRTHGEVAAFLAAALGCPSPAKCDSVRVAGMVELLRTQGLWFASLRLAYYDTAVGCTFADVVASADPDYVARAGSAGDNTDPESNRGRRVATRAELQALATALEAAFSRLAASIQPDDTTALLDEAMSVAGEGSQWMGTEASPGADAACTGAGAGGQELVHSPTAVVARGRPSVAARDSVYAAAARGDQPGAATSAELGGMAGFLRERRPSFTAMAHSSLAGAVMAAQMSAAVERAALEHSAYPSEPEVRNFEKMASNGSGSASRTNPGLGPDAAHRPVRALRGSIELCRRPPPAFAAAPFLSVYGEGSKAGSAGGAGVLRARSSLGDIARAASPAAPAAASRRSSLHYYFQRCSAGTQDREPVDGAIDVVVTSGEEIRAAETRADTVSGNVPGAPSAPVATKPVTAGVAQDPGLAALATAFRSQMTVSAVDGAHVAGARADKVPTTAKAQVEAATTDIPVSYGQEAVRLACALGWARDDSREQLIAALVQAAREHLECCPGWPSWRSTVPSLERLISTALSYFVANDLYTASCRFLKHAKGSFGLAVLCSLEPDRLCMGAWGQPMAMSFSQAHRAVLYGSETNCAMIPIASRRSSAPEDIAQAKAQPAARGSARVVPTSPDDAIVTHADSHVFEVRRVEDRLAETITLNGETIEVMRDASRYSGVLSGGGGGFSTYSAAGRGAAGASALGASVHSTASKEAGAGGAAGHSTYSVRAGGQDEGGGAVMSEDQLRDAPAGRARGGPVGEATEDGHQGPLPQSALARPLVMAQSADIGADELRDVVQGYDDHPLAGLLGRADVSEEDEEVLVDNGWGPAFATHRIDIDEGSGEMMQLVLTDPADPASASDNADGWAMFRVNPFVRLRVYQLRTGREVDSRADFEAQERIVQLVGNPYVTFSPSLDLTPGRDYVADDLADVSRVLARIRESWTDPLSLNRQTAQDLWALLDKMVEFSLSAPSSPERPGIDLLITGVESSLWLAEQWAGDLKLVFPQLNVQAVSANKVISVLGNARGRIPPTGSTFCRSSPTFLAEHHTLCIAVSQSGQTFPTIHAARILAQLLPGRVFALCGNVDTKMSLALGQRVALHSPFTRRVFNSCAGGRCAEPPSVVCVALHQTMSELLAFLVVRMRTRSVAASGRPLGMIVSGNDMVDLRAVRDRFIDETAPQLTGRDAAGRAVESKHHNLLVQQGRKWAQHVIETPTAWVLSLIHILATVVSGWPIVYAVVHGICLGAGASKVVDTALSKIALAVDSVIYMFLPIIYAVLLRAMQRRPLWHRMGKRTIVVADVPYVHQILETFVSKMYALSYGIASVEVHGANPVDHLVHRFTHRVVRGLLIALGRPDGRLYSQTKSESWVLLGLLQAKVITSWGHQPEVVSIGHNPYHPPVVDTHLQLPTNRPRLLIEALEHTTGPVDPNQLWASRRHMVTSKFPLHEKARQLLQEVEGAAATAAATAATAAATASSNVVISMAGAAQKPGPAAPLNREVAKGKASADGTVAAGVMGQGGSGGAGGAPERDTAPFSRGSFNAYSQLSADSVLNLPAGEARPLLGPSSMHVVGGHLLYGIFKKAELSKMWDKLAVVRQLASVLSTKEVSESVAREAVAAVGSTLEDVLHKQTVMEQLIESRYLSLERMLAFMVMFHAMARRTADWWPLTFDIARSQSGLRVATTAAPVTASELEQSWAETLAGDVVEAAEQRNEAAGRERLRQILSSYLRKRTAGKRVE